jgi:hypothetical protein
VYYEEIRRNNDTEIESIQSKQVSLFPVIPTLTYNFKFKEMRPYAFVFQYASFLLMMATLASCSSLEKDIVLPEPPPRRQLVVECYLEQGKPYRMALTESVNYLASREIPIVNQAQVKISSTARTDAWKTSTG